jgi:predicted lipoprotein with Yx(FWY)xxD motif
MTRTLILAAALGIAASAASAAELIAVETEAGRVLASGETGLTLYTFRKDARNASNCYGDCAAKWPPFSAPASAEPEGAIGIIERNGGTRQWALNGKPLYFWAGDSAMGYVTGDGVGGVWDAVRQ